MGCEIDGDFEGENDFGSEGYFGGEGGGGRRKDSGAKTGFDFEGGIRGRRGFAGGGSVSISLFR